MKIGQPQETPSAVASSLQKAAQAPQQAVVAQGTPAVSKGTGVTVSNLAKTLENSALTSADADVDTAKVASVRDAIAAGTFVADAEKIADKMLANAQEILNRTKH